MAAPYGPDVVALLETDVTYGSKGDHGGHNRLIQSIPLIFSGPGVGSRDSYRAMRLVDVLPTVLEQMGIDYDRATSTERRCGCRAASGVPQDWLKKPFSIRRARSSAETSTFRGVSRNTLSAMRCMPPSSA